MDLYPEMELGWLNGWLLLATLGLTEGILFLVFPREEVAWLFDRSGWSRRQKTLTVAGKLFALGCILLLTITPLKTGRPVFGVGVSLVTLGLSALVRAMIDFRQRPAGRPATGGIYRLSRHPQIMATSLVILGICIATGSWPAVFLLLLARLFGHPSLLAEEEACLAAYGPTYRQYMEAVPRYLAVG